MKKTFLILALFASTLAFGQITPQPSPTAMVAQTVGTTRITVDYSRPGVKGREIFGKLIPYGKVWRTGANSSTKIETTTDITVEGQPLPAGKYAILSFPDTNEWTIVFSKNLGVSEQSYKAEDDVLRVKAKPMANTMTESFTIDLSDVKADGANLNFSWDKTKVSLKLGVDIEANVEAAATKQTNDASNALQSAADFMMNKGNLDKASALVDKSLALKETYRNAWTKAQLLDKQGKPAEALAFAQKAQTLGANEPFYQFSKDAIEKGITDLKAKIPAVPSIPAEIKNKRRKYN